MKEVSIFTDGACQGNPGPGGWGALLVYGSKRLELSGGEPATTNNRMELAAAIEALRVLKEPCRIRLTTDSSYLKDGITKWIRGWKARGWRTSAKQAVKNEDLWRALDAVSSRHQISWHWVKGHAGHAENELCDRLAVAAIDALRRRHSPAELKRLLQAWTAAQQSSSELL